MKSRKLNSIVVMATFVALAIPTILAAQSEQGQHNNQPVLKNLNTLEDTTTIAECTGDPSPGIADKHGSEPDADTMNKQPGNPCFGAVDYQQCPPGAQAKSPGGALHCGHPILEDYGRSCPIIFFGHKLYSHCYVDQSTHTLTGYCPLY